MTDVLDQAAPAPGEEIPDDPAETAGDGIEEAGAGVTASPAEAARPARGDLLEADRRGLAALLAAAGLIHLVMAPSHLGESGLEGAGFVISGWVQLGLALALLARPARWMLHAAVASSLAMIAVWAYSRTAGLPFGAHAGHAESVSIVDGPVVAFEAVAAVIAALMLWRGGPGRRTRDGRWGLALPGAVLALTTVAIASPQARDHAVDSHGGRGGASHDHEAASEDDLGLSLLDNGHQHESGEVALDDATQAQLAVQLAGTSQLVQRYPTVADAEAAGYRRAGPFAPGLGTHYMPPDFNPNRDGVIDAGDIDDPMLVFDGDQPESPLAGFMYLVIDQDEPQGFVGGNDHWHYHTNVCIAYRPDGAIDTPFGADLEGVTDAMCADAGGTLIDYTGWMVHVWTVPGYLSDRGVFSEINPVITCQDGTYYTIPVEEIGSRDSVCRDA